MKSGLLWMLGGVIGLSAQAMAQTAPICPVASDVQFASFGPFPSPLITVLTPALPVQMFVRFYPDPASTSGWDVFFPDATINGYSISATGYTVPIPGFVTPGPRFFSLGNLAAGTYTVTIRPFANNLSPPVACPVLVVPMVVNALPGSEPVPLGFAPLAVLSGLLATAGLWFSRRRYRLS